MIVVKFGGTSVGTAERIRQLVEIVSRKRSKQPIVVVSALSKMTDTLIRTAQLAESGTADIMSIKERHMNVMRELGLGTVLLEQEFHDLLVMLQGIAAVGELTPRSLDYILSFGERMSSKIVAAFACKNGLQAHAYAAYDAGFVTDSRFGRADILPETYTNVSRFVASLPAGEIPVITGFIAKDTRGVITTIGRGGSDYTAAIIAAAVNAESLEIWTDVNGVMTADPRIVPEARTVATISFAEASELAHFGAKVLHPRTIRPAMLRNIPVKVLNTIHPEHAGTTILEESDITRRFTSIVCKRNVTALIIRSEKMLDAYGYLSDIFGVFGAHKIPVDMIFTSEVSVAVTVDSDRQALQDVIADLQQLGDITVEESRASISVIGLGIKSTPDVAVRVFKALSDAGINVEMTSLGASDINISVVVQSADADKAVSVLHRALFGSLYTGVET